MTRILVTGASGFIGRALVPLLAERGHEVHASSRSGGPLARGVRWHRGDLLDTEASRSLIGSIRPEALVHLAWCADPGSYRESPDNLAWTEASVRLLRSFAAAGGRRAVLVGSVFEYDWRVGVCREDGTAARAATLYGVCKSALGSIVSSAAPALDLSCAWARVFWLYGPHEPPGRLVSSVIERLLDERPAVVSAGTQRRDFSHVRDVAGALVALAECEVQGPVNIGSGSPVAVRDVALRIGSLMGREHLIALGHRGDTEQEPPLVVADVGRLADEVGFRPTFDLDSGLRETIDWWRSRRCGSQAASALAGRS